MVAPKRKSRVKAAKRPRTRRSRQLLDDDEEEEEKEEEVKIIKKEVTSLLVSLSPVSGVLIGEAFAGDWPLVEACGH